MLPSIGDIVWVKTGWGSHEEPGKVLEVGCAFTYESDDGSERSDGILVFLNVSNERGVFAPSAVRPFDDEQNIKPGSRTRGDPPVVTRIPRANLVTPSDIDQTSKRKSVTDGDTRQTKRNRNNNEIIQDTTPSSATKNDTSSITLKKRKGQPKEDKSVATCIDAVVTQATSIDSAMARVESDDSDDIDDEEDDVDDDDKPYKVEYSSTGRATCRRCDELIRKGELRVSHVPLFRGKAGFTVYRHLECAVFSEQVQCAEDVGGWRQLEKSDRELLALRVEESKLEVQKENEELEPDELVPTVFQGETRSSPAGLTATLLPFQVEGASWMRHQEVFETGIHGGILADEMGMVNCQV
jgi:hypothetical protein